MNYIVNINKDNNFIEFLRNITYFEKSNIVAEKNNNYLKELIESLSENDKKSIEDFKKDVFNNDYVIYKNYKIKNGIKNIYDFYISNKTSYININNKLNNLELIKKKFNDLVWEKENEKLEKIKFDIENFNIEIINKILDKVEIFFDTKIKELININLLINFDENFPLAYANPCYSNLINLHTSNLRNDSIQNIIGSIIHEYVHLLNNNSEIYQKLANKYIIYKDLNWKTKIFPELIAYSISSGNFIKYGYINKLEEFKNSRSINYIEDKIREEKDELHKIIGKSIKISKKTEEYLDNNKTIDQDYLDYLFDEYNKK